MADLPTPISRQDELLHNIADGTPDISDLEPISREEEYLKYIALNGTGGGGGGDLPLPVSISNGGTGATNVSSARTNLDIYSKAEVNTLISNNTIQIVQTTGESSATVMSQKAVTDSLNNGLVTKVDKVDGKQLSTNDFTNEYKTKLDGISEGATQTAIVQTTGDSTTSVMSQNAVTHMYDNISIGVNSTLTNNTPGEISKSIAIGGQSEALSNNNGPSIAIGYNVKTLSPNSVAIGHGADVVAQAGNSVAIGSFSRATEDSVVSFGSGIADDNVTYRRLVNVDDPTSEYEAANKKYVDDLFSQVNTKTIPISQGGTGATDLVNARTNLELLKEYVLYYNASGTNSTITISDAYTNYEKIGVYAVTFTGGYPAYNEMLPAVSNVLPVFELNYEGDETENTIFRGTFLSFSENNVYFSSTAASSVWNTGYSKNLSDGMKVVKIIGYKY